MLLFPLLNICVFGRWVKKYILFYVISTQWTAVIDQKLPQIQMVINIEVIFMFMYEKLQVLKWVYFNHKNSRKCI